MIPAKALGFREWEDRQIVWEKTKELWRELRLCDECGQPIETAKDAVACYVNRLEAWSLVHSQRCSMDLVLRENRTLADIRALEETPDPLYA